ncbi:MAG: ribbon-helix-helix protein, CopG family [Phycisphaeraceae bacterium]
MADSRTVVLSARVDKSLAERIETLARGSGVTASRLIEQLLQTSVEQTITLNSEAGSAILRFIAEANLRDDRPVDPEHPGVSLWELDANIWPRHFFKVVCEFGLDEQGGSTEIWLLWRGEEVEQIRPEEYLARERGKGGVDDA